MTTPTPFRIIILGAGPAGLAAALALKNSNTTPIELTLLEQRASDASALGGAVNLTPLALRYLDSLGVGARLRARGRGVSAIELVSHRTGYLIARLWPGADGVRVLRQDLVECMREVASEAGIEIVYGARTSSIKERNDGIEVEYATSEGPTTVLAHMVVGADGIHSQARGLVDPERKIAYSGKCVAMGYASATEAVRADGAPLITDTSLVSRGSHSLLLSYYTPSNESMYLAAVMPVPEVPADETGSTRAGWAVRDADKDGVRSFVRDMFAGGALGPQLSTILELCAEWRFFPVYSLPPGGKWSSAGGRILLIGDAAHAMPPQGESTGVAIEDGVLLAHVLSRRGTRTPQQLVADYERLRRADIDKLFAESTARWNAATAATSWLASVLMDWVSWAVVGVMNWRTDHFARDVRSFVLPE